MNLSSYEVNFMDLPIPTFLKYSLCWVPVYIVSSQANEADKYGSRFSYHHSEIPFGRFAVLDQCRMIAKGDQPRGGSFSGILTRPWLGA